MSTPAIETTNAATSVDVAQQHPAVQDIGLTAKGGGITFTGKLFTYVCRLAITVVLTRSLGAEQYGLYNLALTALTVAAVLSAIGLDAALVRYIAIFARRHDEARLWGTLQVGLGTTALMSVIIGIGLYVLAGSIADHIFHKPELASLLQLASLIVPFLALNIVIASATQGFKKMQYATVARDIIQPLLRLLLIMALIFIGVSATGALLIFGVAVVITSGMLLYFLHNLFSLTRSPRTAKRETKELLSFSFPVFLSDLMTTFRENVQSLLLGALSTIASVGIFAVANQITMIGHMFHTSIATASKPIISELHDRDARLQLERMYQTTTKWSFTANLPLFLVLMLFPAQVLSLFGKSFADGAPALMLLACANMADVSTGMCGAVLDMTGYTKLKLFNAIVRFALSIGLSVLLIPQWGIVGAAVAALIVVGTVNMLRVLQVCILLQLFPYNKSFFKPVLAGLVALIVVWILSYWIPSEDGFGYMISQIMLLFVVYVSMVVMLGLSAEDRAVLSLVRRRLNRRKDRKR